MRNLTKHQDCKKIRSYMYQDCKKENVLSICCQFYGSKQCTCIDFMFGISAIHSPDALRPPCLNPPLGLLSWYLSELFSSDLIDNLDATETISSSTTVNTKIFKIDGNDKKAYPLVMVTNSGHFELKGKDKRMNVSFYSKNTFY